jgi:hypothetical protein
MLTLCVGWAPRAHLCMHIDANVQAPVMRFQIAVVAAAWFML